MMKKNLGLMAVLLALASCSSDDVVEQDFVNVSETFTLTAKLGNIQTRSTNTSLQTTMFQPGCKLGAYVLEDNVTFYNNILMTAGESGNLNAGENLYWGVHESAKVLAYQPYNASWANTGTNTFTVAIDQSTDEAYLGSDLVYGTASGKNGEGNINVNFNHKLAKVVVTVLLEGDSNLDLADATVTICGVKAATDINLADGKIGMASGDNIDIIAGKLSATANSAAAIIVPQTVVSGSKLVEVKIGDKTFSYILASDKTFAENTEYTFKLNAIINENNLLMMTSTINAWGNGDTSEGNLIEVNSEDPTYTISWTEIDNWKNLADGYFEACAYVYAEGLTDKTTSDNTGSGLICEIGYGSTKNPVDTDWSWNSGYYKEQQGNNYMFQGKTTNQITVPGTYYYTFRFKYGEAGEWVYAGTDGVWDGTNSIAGSFKVE